jgi:hypothetical protein
MADPLSGVIPLSRRHLGLTHRPADLGAQRQRLLVLADAHEPAQELHGEGLIPAIPAEGGLRQPGREVGQHRPFQEESGLAPAHLVIPPPPWDRVHPGPHHSHGVAFQVFVGIVLQVFIEIVFQVFIEIVFQVFIEIVIPNGIIPESSILGPIERLLLERLLRRRSFDPFLLIETFDFMGLGVDAVEIIY